MKTSILMVLTSFLLIACDPPKPQAKGGTVAANSVKEPSTSEEQSANKEQSAAQKPSVNKKPSFDCSKAPTGSVEALICNNSSLIDLDNQLTDVYTQAKAKVETRNMSTFKAMQRGWIKGRDDCWKSNDKRLCIKESYTHRISELQAQYRLVPHLPAIRYSCNNNPANEFIVTFFETTPETVYVERGDSVSIMHKVDNTDGNVFQGRNETFTQNENQGDLNQGTFVWGYQAPEITCNSKPVQG